MVLTALGDEHTETRLATVLHSYEFGTPASRAMCLTEMGYRVQFGESSLDALGRHLEDGLFPIVFVRADLLPWADFGGFHALVMVGITATQVALLDPALDDGPTQLDRDSFLIAWEKFDCLAAVISR